jgi:hypothetical protein
MPRQRTKNKIDRIELTSDNLTSRAGLNLHLTYFDHLAADPGYAATIETDLGDMVSSHQMKRFLNGFSFCRNFLFRRLLQDLFLWRLRAKKPDVVLFGQRRCAVQRRGRPHLQGS